MALGRAALCSKFSFYYYLWLCVIVVEISGVAAAFRDGDYYFYFPLDSEDSSDFTFDLKETDAPITQLRSKRDVKSTPDTSFEKVDPLDPFPKTLNNKTKILKDPPTQLQLGNVGVNGTGQRKNVTRVLPPLMHNLTSSVNTPLKSDVADKAPATPPSILPNNLSTEEDSIDDEFDKNELENNNITAIKTDTHIFYNSTTYNDPEIGKRYWVDLNPQNSKDVKINELLSNSHRRAATIKLSFEFPFYGHYIKNVTIATGGFLYTGNYVHSWLAATQYVAPLMANFDTGLSNYSLVKYMDNGTAFTVEWERVVLQDKPGDGEFTFQTTLHSNGDVVFVYKTVPLLIKDINEQHHPVKVGLSDAYIVDRTIFYVRRKTIFEYHRVTFNRDEIKNWTAIYLKALPTCLNLHNCSACLTSDLNLDCTWCPSLNQCSTGQDRNRQYWLDNSCELKNVSDVDMCHNPYSGKFVTGNDTLNYDVEDPVKVFDQVYMGNSQLGASGYMAIIFLIAMVCGFGMWTVYAYRNPHTTSGQILIRYRPSQWRWRRGEARYTAATIHM